MNYIYGSLHFIVTAGAVIYLYRRCPGDYPRWRNTLALTTVLALIGFVFWPLMPPRLLYTLAPGSYGFVDTLARYPTFWSFDSGAINKISNQYAAMPSLHFGWSLFCATSLAPTAAAPTGPGGRRPLPAAHAGGHRPDRPTTSSSTPPAAPSSSWPATGWPGASPAEARSSPTPESEAVAPAPPDCRRTRRRGRPMPPPPPVPPASTERVQDAARRSKAVMIGSREGCRSRPPPAAALPKGMTDPSARATR